MKIGCVVSKKFGSHRTRPDRHRPIAAQSRPTTEGRNPSLLQRLPGHRVTLLDVPPSRLFILELRSNQVARLRELVRLLDHAPAFLARPKLIENSQAIEDRLRSTHLGYVWRGSPVDQPIPVGAVPFVARERQATRDQRRIDEERVDAEKNK